MNLTQVIAAIKDGPYIRTFAKKKIMVVDVLEADASTGEVTVKMNLPARKPAKVTVSATPGEVTFQTADVSGLVEAMALAGIVHAKQPGNEVGPLITMRVSDTVHAVGFTFKNYKAPQAPTEKKPRAAEASAAPKEGNS